jgi:hypothetical protein
MRIVVHATFSVFQGAKKSGVNLVRGHVVLQNEVGHTEVPIRVTSFIQPDKSLGNPFLNVDAQATYNGRKSIFSPSVDEETVNTLKGIISASQLFTLTDAEGESIELELEPKDGQLVEVGRRVRMVIDEATSGRLAEMATKAADALAKKAADAQAKAGESQKPSALENLKNQIAGK